MGLKKINFDDLQWEKSYGPWKAYCQSKLADLMLMLELARRQPGYRWAEMGPSLVDPTVYLVVSEWDDVEQVRAWEHEEEHSGVMEKWEPLYREPLLHQRFVPWRRPAP